jgi:hypothetical protein
MKNYPEPSPENDSRLHDAADLEFPVAPDFNPVPPRIDFQVMLKRIEENMAWRSTRPGQEERRLATKVNVEFIL